MTTENKFGRLVIKYYNNNHATAKNTIVKHNKAPYNTVYI